MNHLTIAISIKSLIFSYDKKAFLKINDLEIPANNIITILGPSGAGKSTFLNILAGFLPVKTGIEYHEKFKNFGYIMQKNNLYEEISVKKNLWISAKNSPEWTSKVWKLSWENFKKDKNNQDLSDSIGNLLSSKSTLGVQKVIKKFKFYFYILKNIKFYIFFLKFRKKYFEKEVLNVLKALEIDDIFLKKAKNISGGQQQRVAFAKSIIKGDNLVLMDEPFSSLDAKIKESTIKLLLKIKQEFNMTIVLVTHDQTDAMKISDKIILLNKGEILQYSNPEELFENPQSIFAAKFIGMPEINFIEKQGEIEYYIRSKYIKISSTSEPTNGKVFYKKNIADNFYYQIHDTEKNIDLEIIRPIDIQGENVKIEYNKDKIFAFDKGGNRVNS